MLNVKVAATLDDFLWLPGDIQKYRRKKLEIFFVTLISKDFENDDNKWRQSQILVYKNSNNVSQIRRQALAATYKKCC